MAAFLRSKCSSVGRTLMGSVGNNLYGGINSSVETVMTRPSHCDAISQQIRTFIQMRTNLKVVDNSGAKRVMCIQSLRGKKGARLGDMIIGSVKEAQPRGKVKKGDVVYGVAATNPFQLVNNSLPFNKYAYLTTHNSFAIVGEPSHTGIPRITFDNQEDTVTDQLNNGVRALMLDTYDFKGGVWLCHSSGGKCNDFTAFEPALDTFKEIGAFLSANPSEIVTLILEDYVHAPNGLTNVFKASGLQKYWFPVSKMPKNGQEWPLVSDMVRSNQRLLVFTSARSKQVTEGIAYQWNFMVESNYGDDGMDAGKCSNRAESAPLNDKTKSLVLMNYFPSVSMKPTACLQHSRGLTDMANTCYGAAGNRWANFIAVDYYKRSEGGGAFQATDLLNGMLLCGCQDVKACQLGSSVVCSA